LDECGSCIKGVLKESFAAEAGRSTTSPAAMRFIKDSDRIRILDGMGSNTSVECVHEQEDDFFKHKMNTNPVQSSRN